MSNIELTSHERTLLEKIDPRTERWNWLLFNQWRASERDPETGIPRLEVDGVFLTQNQEYSLPQRSPFIDSPESREEIESVLKTYAKDLTDYLKDSKNDVSVEQNTNGSYHYRKDIPICPWGELICLFIETPKEIDEELFIHSKEILIHTDLLPQRTLTFSSRISLGKNSYTIRRYNLSGNKPIEYIDSNSSQFSKGDTLGLVDTTKDMIDFILDRPNEDKED